MNLLSDAVETLTWSSVCEEISDSWRARYKALINAKLTDWLSQQSELVAKAFHVLDIKTKDALTQDPVLVSRLLRLPASMTHTFMSVCEKALRCPPELYFSGCASGKYFPTDFESKLVLPSRFGRPDNLTTLDRAQAEQVLSAFESSLGELNQHRPIIGRFSSRMTFVVVLRRDASAPEAYSAGSFNMHPGLTLFVNPSHIMNNRAKVIDSFVHEAIHALLYMYEAFEQKLCSEHPKSFRVTSPWTGRSLNLDQYTQACFVWWGLYSMWYTWNDLSSICEQDVSYFRDQARAGFADHAVAKLLDSIDPAYLPRQTVDALREIERRFLALQ